MDVKEKLSILWIFAMFNYLYNDVFTLMDSKALNQLITGTIDGIQMTQGVLLGAAVLMETAMIMVVLSRVLEYRTNRLANITFGTVHTLSVFLSMFVGTPAPYYIFVGIIEMVTTLLIVWLAWTWKPR